MLAQHGVEVLVNTKLPCIDNAHGHTGFHGVVKKDGMNCFACGVVAAEGEADIGDATRDLGCRQVLANPTRGLKEVDGIAVVFVDACCDGKNIGIENNVVSGKIQFVS